MNLRIEDQPQLPLWRSFPSKCGRAPCRSGQVIRDFCGTNVPPQTYEKKAAHPEKHPFPQKGALGALFNPPFGPVPTKRAGCERHAPSVQPASTGARASNSVPKLGEKLNGGIDVFDHDARIAHFRKNGFSHMIKNSSPEAQRRPQAQPTAEHGAVCVRAQVAGGQDCSAWLGDVSSS